MNEAKLNSSLIGMYILFGKERDYPKNQQEVNPLSDPDMAMRVVLWYPPRPDLSIVKRV